MRGVPRWSGEMLLALGLLAGAMAADFLWFRPLEREHRTLVAARRAAEERLSQSRRAKSQSDEVLGYVAGGDPATWRRPYETVDPILRLEAMRRDAGLEREEIAFRRREEMGELKRANYVVSVSGSYAKQVRFLQKLEQATPLVTVEQVTMVDRPDGPGLDLRLDLWVLTLAGEGTE